ncbi:rabenosyn-5 [Rhineura floridana]|uniref:rabenosyn-5 n=1 Tax=Rhineura floridana TaxID=261503 RepID=UPI002AC82CB4|nr:rabenosyn-5 [Rhineura floridana]XP_061474443.1 rabenosyn-5 [Rhineura floridana]XP_061474444.1 rabenosyn-5 [Rhineura floridana]XP_061474445.1 rabenosyn-5 [Rhineura floridana]XP_061474447.1 rabenosyn-5 [Rhineura floridana]XP_061474448.1 rabenosyn-5 [Rhineura floridana]XP_061474449.1 rabenosyn-5 [Rhineura floridana]XP_061474450.1 rabenosyn-5 [Rhineura floridana]
MATSYTPPFDDPGEVREGFLCPLCLKDLQSFYQLQSHYEEEHSSEDKDVKGQLKNLLQKAKKAKNKLLKLEDDRTDGGPQEGYESYSYGGVDPYMWEPQELGAMKSHLSDFKRHRAARIDHYVVEVNKLIIRLEKLTSFDRTNTDSAKIRAIEKSVVPWVNDQDVPFCPDCGNKFSIRNRRHHCRLCGSIMCKKCMELVSLPFANKLTTASKEVLASHTSPNCSPNSIQGSRRGSISSISSVSSVLDDKDDDRLRCCRHCKDTLLKREQQIDEREYTPDIVKLYEKLQLCMEKVDQKAPEYIKMAESLNAGETTYSLEHANSLRMEVQKMYELIDGLSKKILTLGLNEEPQPHPRTLQLQRMIRYSATLFVQEKLLGLMSLPTQEQYEELKEKKKQELERKLQMERQAALESQRRLEEKHMDYASRSLAASNGEVYRPKRVAVKKAEGWLPTASISRQQELADPLLQQIDNITSFIKQAKEANRLDEVQMLQENLQQLQDEYDQQQTDRAIELSRRQAEMEDMQREQLQILCEKEWEREHKKRMSQHSRTRSLDFREVKASKLEIGKESINQIAQALDLDTTQNKSNPGSKASSPSDSDQLPATESPVFPLQSLGVQEHDRVIEQNKSVLINPFENEPAVNTLKRKPDNPFTEESSRVSSLPTQDLHSDKKEYNPFEYEDSQQANGIAVSAPNPFADAVGNQFHVPIGHKESGNPFEELSSSMNPFEDDDEVSEDNIEEELLLQQIDNIKAYIFDAKHSGRMDEVEVLTENLKELKRTLAKQKEKSSC